MAKQLEDDDEVGNEDLQDLMPGNVQVKLPSGAPYQVHDKEKELFEERVRLYMENNEFTHISDLQDVDRVIIYELFILRYGTWAMRQRDYWGTAVDEAAMQKSIKEFSHECRMVKASLGLDKVSRDRAKGVDSPAAYIANLGQRALAFGYKRNEEFNKMLELGQHLRALITLYNNCDEEERRENRISPEEILRWIEYTFFKEYDEIDRKFRQDGDPEKGFEPQIAWIRDM